MHSKLVYLLKVPENQMLLLFYTDTKRTVPEDKHALEHLLFNKYILLISAINLILLNKNSRPLWRCSCLNEFLFYLKYPRQEDRRKI